LAVEFLDAGGAQDPPGKLPKETFGGIPAEGLRKTRE
jgi:hypothetical protein